MKTLLYNKKTGELKATVAKVSGDVYKGYLKEGFKPIGMISGGFNLFVRGFDKKEKKEFGITK